MCSKWSIYNYFSSVIGAPAGIASAGFTLVFSLTTGIIKKVLQITRNKKRNTKIFCACQV